MNTSDSSEPRNSFARLLATVMVCNPLLLLSPMFLLYGIYKAVTAPALFVDDTSNTLFNFIALALYVLAVCVTATLLARKRIIADATMLLLLQALLFVSPFILIAHGVFIDNHMAVALGSFGMASGLAQLEILRKRLPGYSSTIPLNLGGALILAANFFAPILFRRGLENNNDTWEVSGFYAWTFGLPLLVAWLNLIPLRSDSANPAPWTKPWFPLLTYFLWLGGTAVQLWTVSYVDDRSLRFSQFTIALWVLAWTAFRQRNAFPARCANGLQNLAPAAALCLPVAGAISGLELDLAAMLFALNLPILWLARGRLPILAYSAASFIGALCCMPMNWIQVILPQATRIEFIALTLAITFIGAMAPIRDSRAGLLGSLAVGILLAGAEFSGVFAFNVALLFLFTHQLRWERMDAPERRFLTLMSAIWITSSVLLSLENSPYTHIPPFIATIVATLALRHGAQGHAISLIPPIASICVLCIRPIFWMAYQILHAPSGILPILAGFVLLAAGAWWSFYRSRKILS